VGGQVESTDTNSWNVHRGPQVKKVGSRQDARKQARNNFKKKKKKKNTRRGGHWKVNQRSKGTGGTAVDGGHQGFGYPSSKRRGNNGGSISLVLGEDDGDQKMLCGRGAGTMD